MSNTALIFSGQGAQSVGMGRDLAEAYPECKAIYDKADEVLGFSLSSVCFEGPEEKLKRSDSCQPAIFVTSTVCRKALALEAGDIPVTATAGLSLGEWSALHEAGALTFEDTLRVLEARGRFMQEACDSTDGGMVSVIGLEMSRLEAICTETGVGIANLNSSAQTVLSGAKDAIDKAAAMATEAGAKRALVLNVAGAFHSPMMAPAAERLEAVLADVEISEPVVPVLSNVTGAPHTDPAAIRREMISQVTCPVKWLSCVEWMQGNGVTSYIECGPGRVLTGLIKRIDGGAALYNIQDAASLGKTVEALKG